MGICFYSFVFVYNLVTVIYTYTYTYIYIYIERERDRETERETEREREISKERVKDIYFLVKISKEVIVRSGWNEFYLLVI